jgi:hypothetical protein
MVGVILLLLTRPVTPEMLLMLAALVFVAVGILVVARTANRVGWVVSAIGLALIGAGVSEIWIGRDSVVAGAIGGTLWFSWFVLVGFLLLWFPTGRPPTPRWRPVEWLGFVGIAVAVSYAFSNEICTDSTESGACLDWVSNPIGISFVPNPEFGPLSGLNYAVLGAFALLSLGAVVIRFARSRGTERLQLKWLLASAVFLVADAFSDDLVHLPDWIDTTVLALGMASLPVSIGVAILKYRLYEIDRVISRTLGYALVVAILAFLYVVVAVWLPSRVIGEQPPIFVAAATLAAAAAFNPLRRLILRAVDRRFYRSRYDTEVVMSSFASRVRDQVDMDRLTTDWIGVVIRTMGPRTAGVWMRQQ